jgi:general stress protein 26
MITTPNDRAWEMMKDIDFCMFVTQGQYGPRSRPMSSVVRKDDGAIWFLTDAGSSKDDEIEKNPEVCLSYSNGSSQFVSITGYATQTSDRAAILDIWTPSAQAFWPNGPDDAAIIAIHVQPLEGEIWDGPSGLVAAAKLAFAAVTGSKPDLGTNAKVNL